MPQFHNKNYVGLAAHTSIKYPGSHLEYIWEKWEDYDLIAFFMIKYKTSPAPSAICCIRVDLIHLLKDLCSFAPHNLLWCLAEDSKSSLSAFVL